MSAESKPVSFGVVGLAAALESTPERVRALVRAGTIRAEFVEAGEPRWSDRSVLDAVEQLLPWPHGDEALQAEHTSLLAQAMRRAFFAEYVPPTQPKGGQHG